MPSFLANVHASMYRDGAPQELTPEQEASKRKMYEKLKPRGRKYVDRIGYENWDPFMKPNDPLDIRQDVTSGPPRSSSGSSSRPLPAPTGSPTATSTPRGPCRPPSASSTAT